MAHEITGNDQVFSVREPMWHGLGTVLTDYPSRADAQHFAHPWEPVAEPIYRRITEPQRYGPPLQRYEEITGFYANARSDTNKIIGVNLDSFVTVDNNEMYDIAEVIEGEDSGSVMFETGGSLKGGAKVWLLLRLRDPIEIPGDPRGATIPYFALQNSHDGSGAFRGQAVTTRIVCANTSQMADIDAEIRGTEFVFRHTKNVQERIDQAREALAGWRLSIADWQEAQAQLISYKVTAWQREEFITRFIPMPPPHSISPIVEKNVNTARKQLKDIITGPTCEGIELTSYGLVQGAVEYLNHARRANSRESRFKRAYLDKNTVVSDAVTIAREVALV
jgi:phage/plasmid-like protein (TIGR03299 family)